MSVCVYIHCVQLQSNCKPEINCQCELFLRFVHCTCMVLPFNNLYSISSFPTLSVASQLAAA